MPTLHPMARLLRSQGDTVHSRESLWDRLPRMLALVGALLIHLMFLFARVPNHRTAPTSGERVGDVIEVRFIDRAHVAVPITSSPSLDRFSTSSRGRTLIVAVSHGQSRPNRQRTVAEISSAPPDVQGRVGNQSSVTGAGVTAPSGRNASDERHVAGAIRSYIQVQPSGNTDVMTRSPGSIVYKATRFERSWTPDHESAMDTALRRAIDDHTIHRTIALPRGMRADCGASPGGLNPFSEALVLASVKCHGDPPPAPSPAAEEAMAWNQTLAPAKPLASMQPPTTSIAPAVPVVWGNQVLCATARASGAPRAPGCDLGSSRSPANGSSTGAMPAGHGATPLPMSAACC